MVKAEGVLEGLAYEAIQYRAHLHATDIQILADVYDRTGKPMGRMPLEEEARWAAVHCRADGLILTGSSFSELMEMLSEVKAAESGRPIVVGGRRKSREHQGSTSCSRRSDRVEHFQSFIWLDT